MKDVWKPDISLPPALWLWLPIGGLVVQGVLEIALSPALLAPLLSEDGPHEFLQALVLVCGFCVALWTLLKNPRSGHPGLMGWIALAALCQFYVGGEELSWGQHLLGWTTPDYWAGINDQNETNLHNTSSWLDQKPRALLLIGVIAGGLVAPFATARWPRIVPETLKILMPTVQFAVISGIVLLVRGASFLTDVWHVRIFERASEVSELYMYYFVFLYMILLKDRIRKIST